MMTETKNKSRVPPHSKESEMMVLGCMLTSVNSLNIGADGLDDTDFYFTEHQIVFSSLKRAYKNDKPADVHLIIEDLKREEKLEAIGGASYITTLAQFAGTLAYMEEYVDLVRGKSILRRMIQSSQQIESIALKDPPDYLGALDEAQKLFYQIGQAAQSSAGLQLRDILSGVKATSGLAFLKELQEKQERFMEHGPEESLVTGKLSHFHDLDKMIDGLGNSNLVILAARPAMGKTALAINIAENIAFKSNLPVGIFSLEMSAEQLAHRMIAAQAQVESQKIKTGSLSGIEYQRIVSCVSEMMTKTVLIDDQPGLKVSELRARARRMKEAYDIQFLVIDYLQLLSGGGNFRAIENRQGEISEISRMLKNLARELDIPVLCLSQLSRKVEERQGHRPLMSDLRESGSIEQDADVVLFLLRREYYDQNDKPGEAELIVAKNRHGSVGSVNLTFQKEFALFSNYAALKGPSNLSFDPSSEFADFTP